MKKKEKKLREIFKRLVVLEEERADLDVELYKLLGLNKMSK